MHLFIQFFFLVSSSGASHLSVHFPHSLLIALLFKQIQYVLHLILSMSSSDRRLYKINCFPEVQGSCGLCVRTHIQSVQGSLSFPEDIQISCRLVALSVIVKALCSSVSSKEWLQNQETEFLILNIQSHFLIKSFLIEDISQ